MGGGVGASLDGVIALLQQEEAGKVRRKAGDLLIADGVYMPGKGEGGVSRRLALFKLLAVVKAAAEQVHKFRQIVHKIAPPERF